MSIASEITRIKGAKASLKSSIEAKGVTVPTTTKIDGYGALVDQISTGITPSGTTNITENGIYDVTNFASANVNVSGGGDSKEDEIITKTISGAYTNNRISKIGEYAFAYCTSLTNVSFPACTSISNYAFFYCTSLTNVSFPECKSINVSAFYQCSKLTTVSFPICTNISGAAFQSCTSLSIASFPACTNIGSNAFRDCRSLTSISFPACTNISGSVFQSCTSLSIASLPACTSIGSYAFRDCYNLLSLYLLGSSVPKLNHINAFSSTPISNYTTSTGGVYGSIIIQPSMMDAFKTATNWSVYSSRFSAWNGVD